MYKIGVAVLSLITITALACGEPSSATTPTITPLPFVGAWEQDTSPADLLTGRELMDVVLESSDQGGVSLVIRCAYNSAVEMENGLRVIINWDEELGSNYEPTVAVRFDEGDVQEGSWELSTDSELTLAPNVDSFISSLKSSKRLVARVWRQDQSTKTAQWGVDGFGGAARPVEERCDPNYTALPMPTPSPELVVREAPDMTAYISADKTSVSKGDTLNLEVTHENIGGSEAGAVTINIHLPDELTATSVQPGTPACSQAGKLERFASQEAGDITGEPGGTMNCLVGTQVEGTKGSIILETTVGDVAAGDSLNIDVWLTSYRTDNVSKDELAWSNNCTSLTLVAGSGGSPTARSLECSLLALIAQSIVVKAVPQEAAPGQTLTLTASYENIPVVDDREEGTIVIDIRLPSELTATKLQQYNDDKVLSEHPTCSHPNQLGEFAREGRGQLTNMSGGTLTCVVGQRSTGTEGRVKLETTVASAISGSTISVDACARREQDAIAADINCTTLTVPVR